MGRCRRASACSPAPLSAGRRRVPRNQWASVLRRLSATTYVLRERTPNFVAVAAYDGMSVLMYAILEQKGSSI